MDERILTPREVEEYRALRATILQRGTARFWVMVAGVAVWASLAVAMTAMLALPLMALIPLIVLAAVFEAVFALHTGVERIGRYIQVFHEPDGTGWEHAAMGYGRLFSSGGMDPLFSPLFVVAAVLNLVPAAIAEPLPPEWAVIGAAHLIFLFRIGQARGAAGRQRGEDLERFTRVRNDALTREPRP